MKLAACYTIFNGEELLELSMKQIESHVDFFVICFQFVSNKGEMREELGEYCKRFLDNPKVILLHFDPNPKLSTKENERNKHQFMLAHARKNGATHILLAAVDHFYTDEDFSRGKAESIDMDWDVTFTKMYTYYKHPTWQLTPMEEYYMPFIIKLYEDTRIVRQIVYPVLVDPSVKVNTIKNYKIFKEYECVLHHYSMIRKDIQNKFNNAAASIRWTALQKREFMEEYENYDITLNPGIKYFSGRKIKVVENYFNI